MYDPCQKLLLASILFSESLLSAKKARLLSMLEVPASHSKHGKAGGETSTSAAAASRPVVPYDPDPSEPSQPVVPYESDPDSSDKEDKDEAVSMDAEFAAFQVIYGCVAVLFVTCLLACHPFIKY